MVIVGLCEGMKCDLHVVGELSITRATCRQPRFAESWTSDWPSACLATPNLQRVSVRCVTWPIESCGDGELR